MMRKIAKRLVGLALAALISAPAAAQPIDPALNLRERIVINGQTVQAYQRETALEMGGPETYTGAQGVLTFRGNHYRDSAAYGTIPDGAKKLKLVWSKPVRGIGEWSGVGWTGQPAIVSWSESMVEQMNIAKAKRGGPLTEVIIGALDGKIHFLDLADGADTRKPISIGAPIKGSVSVDPRGYPLLYCGQGIFEVRGKTVKCGTRVFSLIDQSLLYFINGKDSYRNRNWYCFDAAPLVDAATDTLLQVGENGLLYTVKLNTQYDAEQGKIAIDPVVDRYSYKSKVTTRPGMENSLAVYRNYGYFADNSGLLICVDLNTLKAVWATPTGDDTDSTIVLEEDGESVWLYTANEMDLRGKAGNIQMRCYDALTGAERWVQQVRVTNNQRGGAYATPAMGKGTLGELVFFNISKTKQGGTLFALSKATGEVVWSLGLSHYSWSSPVALYDESGRGYVLVGNSKGILRLVDGLTGKQITQINLKTNIEGSPAVFGDMIVVGTRGGRIAGIRIS